MMKMSELKNRSEILFLYDIKDTNPNGDPMDENKPRIDEETQTNIVTDVRLKRTVRDYLKDYKKQEIFVVEEIDKEGNQKTKDERLKELKIDSPEKALDLMNKYVDLRLFGATIAVKKASVTRTGPVQFRFGRSLHKVEPMLIQGTTVMPSSEGKKQGTMTQVYVLPYSLIAFYGIVNENAGKFTNLKSEDIDLLMEGIWNGTKNLITRSKVGQMPRLLVEVVYKEKNYHIGDLDKKIKLVSDNELAIRDLKDYKLDFKELLDTLKANKDRIEKIRYKADEKIDFSLDGVGIKTEEFKF
jgi:CRISPR-associated protein Csh2